MGANKRTRAIEMPANDAETKRFTAKFRVDENGCWLWTAGHTPAGYGVFFYRGSLVRAHRLSYAMVHGTVEPSLEIDHLCKNPACVNPEHLEEVTAAENLHRSDSPSGLNHRKTHCPQGHPYAGSNLIKRPTGFRECRTCKYAANRARQARSRR